jgi:hypothetical protein
MFVTRKSLSRRTVLKGMGTTLALPFLESMVPAFQALAQSPAKPPMRFGAILTCVAASTISMSSSPRALITSSTWSAATTSAGSASFTSS